MLFILIFPKVGNPFRYIFASRIISSSPSCFIISCLAQIPSTHLVSSFNKSISPFLSEIAAFIFSLNLKSNDALDWNSPSPPITPVVKLLTISTMLCPMSSTACINFTISAMLLILVTSGVSTTSFLLLSPFTSIIEGIGSIIA